MLDLARIEHGLEEMPVSEVAVEPLINGVIEEMQLRALRAGITFHVRCELHTVWSNERGLRQILTNLVSNAVKFASPGVVVVGSEEGEIYVEDEGPGLDRDEQERIFEPFQQLSWTDDGVGLGLSLARRLAQAVASDLVVTSNPGRGSRFRVLFLSYKQARWSRPMHRDQGPPRPIWCAPPLSLGEEW